MNFEQPLKQEVVKTPENKLKEGVDFVFEQNPELAEIGTKEQYSEYLNTIFSESNIKDIYQHQTKDEFENFNKEGTGRLGYGFYFSKYGNDYVKDLSLRKKLVVLDIKNPIEIKDGEYMKKVYSLLDDKNQSSDDFELKEKAKMEIEQQYREESDALIGDKNGNLKHEIKVFKSNQIYILGSKQDIEGFKEFVSRENK
jgi:hypothetical protein